MDTVIVTLKLPADLYSLVKKYAKQYIINETLSNSYANRNTSVPISSLLESKEEKLNNPSLDDVVAYAKEIKCSVNPQRYFTYYEKRGWVDKNGLNFDWKQKLKEWGTYNLETTKQPSKNAVAKCDFSNDDSFKSAVADLIAENKKEEVA